jgi:hypothetical protein
MRGDQIKASLSHDGGAYMRCSYCGRYSDNPDSFNKHSFPCDCGQSLGWSGSFIPPDETSKWSESK